MDTSTIFDGGAAQIKTDEAHKAFQVIPGVGPSISQNFIDLGLVRLASLRGQDPEQLYHDLCALRGVSVDRCVLYLFRLSVYFAENAVRAPELLKWWNWKDRPHRT